MYTTNCNCHKMKNLSQGLNVHQQMGKVLFFNTYAETNNFE